MLARERRLHGEKTFTQIYASKKVLRNELLRFNFDFRSTDHARFGTVTSKKLGKANVRNRLRRQIYAIIDTYLKANPVLATSKLRVAINLKEPVLAADFATLDAAVTQLLSRLKIEG